MDQITILTTVNAATLVATLVFGARMLRFINRMEFKVEEMWLDYKTRTAPGQVHMHSREDD